VPGNIRKSLEIFLPELAILVGLSYFEQFGDYAISGNLVYPVSLEFKHEQYNVL
jgi:hypothetical protein